MRIYDYYWSHCKTAHLFIQLYKQVQEISKCTLITCHTVKTTTWIASIGKK